MRELAEIERDIDKATKQYKKKKIDMKKYLQIQKELMQEALEHKDLTKKQRKEIGKSLFMVNNVMKMFGRFA